MSKHYRVDIWKNSALICNIEVAITRPDEFLQVILEQFPEAAGFEKKVFLAESEKRILETGPEGTNLLASLKNYKEFEQ